MAKKPDKLYSANTIANQFLELAEEASCSLTNMQLQKLVYIANGFHLGFTEKPLTYNNCHAWQFGPVIPSLYKALQHFGNGHVTGRLEADDDSIPADSHAANIIKKVWESYGHISGRKLSAITHIPGSPWQKTWERDNNKFGVIPIETIAEYYRERINSHAAKS